jgi:hypothetical protein
VKPLHTVGTEEGIPNIYRNPGGLGFFTPDPIRRTIPTVKTTTQIHPMINRDQSISILEDLLDFFGWGGSTMNEYETLSVIFSP